VATISDVAKKAGVSIATVSYVLNGKTELVREETAERILRIAEEMHYTANPVARGLATGSSYTVAVVLPDHAVFSHPIGSQEFLGVADELYLSSYSMLIKPSHKDQRRMNNLHATIPKHVAGVLVLGPMSLDSPDLEEVRRLNKPVVVMEDVPDEWNLTRVNVDNYKAAKLVVDHLLDRGHTHIGVISQTRVSGCMTRRIEGCRDSLREHGLDPEEFLLIVDIHTQDDLEVRRASESLIDSPSRPTALVSLNSALMPAIAKVISDRGLKVPEQLAVGCVDYAMPSNFNVKWPIVTLKADLRRQGELAARTLVEMLRTKKTCVDSVYIDPELVILEP
jgi:DNA-binding LacI/PurR family transcriptional regulator